MQTKIIEKIAKNYELIKALDAEIIQLEKTILTLIEDKAEMQAQFSTNKTTNIAENNKDQPIEGLKSIEYQFLRSMWGIPDPNNTPNKQALNLSLNNITSIKILSLIISEKQSQRTNIISNINKLICGKSSLKADAGTKQ